MKKDISTNLYQNCLILCSKILLNVFHILSLTILFLWQHTEFQTSTILKAFLVALGVQFSYLQMHMVPDIQLIQQAYKYVSFSLFAVKLYLTVVYPLWCSVVNAYLHRVLHKGWLGWRFKLYPFSNLPPALNPNPGLEIKKCLLTLYPAAADQPSWYTKLYWKYNIQSVRI